MRDFVLQIQKFLPLEVIFIIIAVIASAMLLTFFALFAGPLSYLERRIAGRVMSRIGPNRVGPQGVVQWLADGFKCFLKEDLIPAGADKILFRFAPYPVFLGVVLTLAVLPFSSFIVFSDINVGILYIVGAWGLVVIGLLAAGWASNNKWSLLGGMRSAAQMISYEIPLVIALLCVVLSTGTLSVQESVLYQGAWPSQWFVFSSPFATLAFLVYLVAAVAEGNRTPFDIPEAESELVAGYNTEYSGMRFLFFFFAEWGNVYVIGAIATALFFGGWKLPQSVWGWAEGKGWFFPNIIEVVVFQLKTWVWVWFIVMLRWTLPRLRVDQLMQVAWEYLTPLAFFALIGQSAWLLFVPQDFVYVRYAMSGLGACVAAYFLWRVAWQLKFTKSKVDVNPII